MSVRRNKGEGSITTTTRNGKTYYKASVTIGYDADGKQIRKYFGSFKKSVVVDKINTVKYEAKTNSLSSDSAITFGNLFYRWIHDYKRNEVQSNTFDEYLVCYRRLTKYPISNVKVSILTVDMMQLFFNDLQKDYSPNVIKKMKIKLKSCLHFAFEKGIVHRNPCSGVILQKVIKKKDDQFKVFSKEEQELIIANLDFRNVIDRLIYVAFYTGLRLGEILALKWVRLIAGILHVREQYQRETVFHEDGSKTYIYVMKDMLKTPHSERDIPIPDKIIKFLNSLERISDLVFCDENGKPLERKRPDRRIKTLCRKLGIDDSRTFHSVRHSYCTRLFEANVPIKTVQVLMGHSNVKITMNVYAHVMKEKKMEVVDVLENI